jgi:hypothetical protein
MDKGYLVYEYNMMEIERYNGRSEEPVKPGKHRITVDTKIAKPAAPADVVIAVDGVEAIRVPIKQTVAGAFSASETLRCRRITCLASRLNNEKVCSCEGFRMPALHGGLPSGQDGVGVRKPSHERTCRCIVAL